MLSLTPRRPSPPNHWTACLLGCLGALVATVAWAGGAPTIRFDHLDRSHGLSQVSVTDVVQDPRGFLWIATQDGLNRYDGLQVEVFVHDPDDPNSLADNLLTGLLQDRDQRLWILCQAPGLLTHYDPVTERFERFGHDPDDPESLLPFAINNRAVLDDGQGHLWLGTVGGGLQRLDQATGRVTRLLPDPLDVTALTQGFVSSLAIDGEGVLWVGTGAGLHRLDPPLDASHPRFRRFSVDPPALPGMPLDGPGHGTINSLATDFDGRLWVSTPGGLARHRADGRFDHFAHDPDDPTTLPSAAVFGILEGRRATPEGGVEGSLWVATAVGLARFRPDGEDFVSYLGTRHQPDALARSAINDALVDQDGTLWVATQGSGLLRHDRHDDTFDAYTNDPLDPSSLASDLIGGLFESRSGILWVTTGGRGVDRYSRPKHKFEIVTHRAGDPGGLTDSMVFALREDSRGDLWVGTQEGGLHRFDGAKGTLVEHYTLTPDDPDRDLGVGWVRTIFEDSLGRFWVGTAGAGLVRLDRDTGKIVERHRNRPADATSLTNDVVLHVFEDSRGRLFVSTAFGWNHFEPADGDRPAVFRQWFPRLGDPTALPGAFVRRTFEDRDGKLWVATGSGLGRFDEESATFHTFRHNPRDPGSLSHDTVQDLYQDPRGDLWVATYGGGLNRLPIGDDPDTDRFEVFTRKDGLPSDVIYGVVPDDGGHLWLSTNFGLSRFDPFSRSFENFTADDGLQSNEFNGQAFFRSPSGELFFGGTGGFNRFWPDAIRRSTTVPPVVLTAFHRLDRPVRFDRALDQLDEVTVTHRDNLIAFEYAALDYALPEKTRYRYRLEGFDHDWIDAGSRRRAAYTNLDGGTYVFHVQGASGDGVWNTEGARLQLVVVPPPWKTWWAYLGYTLLTLLAVFGTVRHLQREAEHRRRSRELEHARRIQLSLLPETPPSLRGYDIAVFMRTATEVGGDYYDFFPQSDGSLYAVTGDATGHGLSAGMMVSMTKSALKALDVEAPDQLLGRLNQVVRAVNPERLNMALAVAHLRDGEVAYSSAAMPPAYVYRAETETVDEVLVPGLPLGGLDQSEYRLRVFEQKPGDVLVMASDGLIDRLCDRGLDGYALLAETVAEQGSQPAPQILTAVLALGETADAPEVEDDVTVLVVKRR